MNEAPFFSIGVTTYKRHDLLRQTLGSIISQTFSDFEVIVGNDDTQETMHGELLGLKDSRVRFVNHARNLGERQNLNALLGMARGRYFTWQFDDDLYALDFLEGVHSVLVEYSFPLCVFTSYDLFHGASFPKLDKRYPGHGQLLSGRQFLRRYFSGRMRAMGFGGVYKTDYLKGMGGAQRLTQGSFALYSEYLLLIHAGLLERVAYINAPLVLFRAHEASWGGTNTEVDLHKEAGENLIAKSVELLARPELRQDFRHNLSCLLKLPLIAVVSKLAARDGFLKVRDVIAYLFSIRGQLKLLKNAHFYWMAMISLGNAGVWLAWPIVKYKFKLAAPRSVLNLARSARAIFLRKENRCFWG
jgi:glycosyltransferase involved in cell wall biosynthesis